MITLLDGEKLAAHREAQASAGWPLLAACPSTAAAGAVAHLMTIAPALRARFVHELNSLGQDPRPEESALVAAYVEANARRGPSGLGRVPVKVIAGVRKDAAIGGIEGWIRQAGLVGVAALPPPALAAGLDELAPVAPRVLRRLVNAMMHDRFGAAPVNDSKELDRFDVVADGRALRVVMTYAPSGGHSSHQLDYHVGLPAGGSFITYEQLWRTSARWDYLTETNAGRSVDHLGVLICTLAALTRADLS